jgi:hypothetical protein
MGRRREPSPWGVPLPVEDFAGNAAIQHCLGSTPPKGRTALIVHKIADGGFREIPAVGLNFRKWPILLKNSIHAFVAALSGVSNHHLINLRHSERVLEGRLFRQRSPPTLQLCFSTLLADCRRYLTVFEWPLFCLRLRNRPQICLKENGTPSAFNRR